MVQENWVKQYDILNILNQIIIFLAYPEFML